MKNHRPFVEIRIGALEPNGLAILIGKIYLFCGLSFKFGEAVETG